MLADFQNTFMKQKYGMNSKDDFNKLCDVAKMGYLFATSTNERGYAFCEQAIAYGIDFDGLNVLDLGCAYGGFSIEAAKLGANVIGVDYDGKLIAYAKINAEGVECKGDVEFLHLDATSIDFMEKLKDRKFDLIVMNDVFEHIYDTTTLLDNISKVSSDRCAIFYEIPNGAYIPYAFCEPHQLKNYLPMIPPYMWGEGTDRNIWYRPWKYYEALFKAFGFDIIHQINYPDFASKYQKEKVIHDFYEKKKSLPDPENNIQKYIEEFESRMIYNSEHLAYQEFYNEYGVDFWKGFAQKKQFSSLEYIEKNIECGKIVLQLDNGILKGKIVTEKKFKKCFQIFRRTYMVYESDETYLDEVAYKPDFGGHYRIKIVDLENKEHMYESAPIYYPYKMEG